MRILDTCPEIKAVITSHYSIAVKRNRIRNFLSDMLHATYEDDPTIPPLEWILTKESISVFRSILTQRSERLAKFSLLQYLDDILVKEDQTDVELPEKGFFAEIDHLLKGITGKSGIYSETIPLFLKKSGMQAAKLRSADLSRMAKRVHENTAGYVCGLDKSIIRQRTRNKARILAHFKATDQEWEDWRWHAKNIIKEPDTLRKLIQISEESYQALKIANKENISFGITPYYLSNFDRELNSGQDRALRAQVIPSLSYVEKMNVSRQSPEVSMDFMLERNTSPIEGITRRYPMIIILKPLLVCPQICVYCQRNWEVNDIFSKSAVLPKQHLDKALEWIADRTEINEVLITGGDPLFLSNNKLEYILERIAKIDHIIRIRIGTRIPVTLPMRVTDSLVRIISRFHRPGKREIIIITHFEHAYEITPQAMAAVQKFRRCGMEVYNQLVFTYYNSRRFEAAYLRQMLRLIGVTSYYTFNTKGKEETDEFRVPIARLLQEQKEESRMYPGAVRTDEIVFNVPGLGKNYLRASQHHGIIAILPNGRRVYEFHPWEKKLFLVDTFIYKDVSVYDYLARLKRDRENITRYKTIWYYY